MDMLKLLRNALVGKQRPKPGYARAGGYAQQIDSSDVDPEMKRTLGVSDAAPAAAPAAVSHDSTLDALAKKAGRLRKPYRSVR